MHTDYWHQAWQAGRIGFHQSRINTRLERLWPKLGVETGARVFAPLCGKSLDMVWLQAQGHAVLGSELSEIAARDFFSEQGWPVRASPEPEAAPMSVASAPAGSDALPSSLRRLSAVGLHPVIDVLVGDYFALGPEHTGDCMAFYDRAALIAMRPEQQPEYVAQLARLMGTGSVGMMITLSYDTREMQGPPFSTPDAKVRAMLSPFFELELLEHSEGASRLGNLRHRGLSTMEEHVYRLQRRHHDPMV